MKLKGDSGGAFRALVEGRVQGVGFRYSCYHEALRLGLTGWVRNTPGGNVEVWAEGPLEKCRELESWLWEGPSRARVRDVHCEWLPALGAYQAFFVNG